MATNKPKKKNVLRYNEYYSTQERYDDLYAKSKRGYKFTKLVELIRSEQNIMLAYRKIKGIKGSKTAGVNNSTIEDIASIKVQSILKYFQARIDNYIPQQVRRVEIPKSNGKTRPLGIPTIEDRIIQQCIKQVLEPICEAKFHIHSYGFRPNRSAHYAIGRIHNLINVQQLLYVVDVDIKGFFDNVNHSKLIKQMWALGIQDKNLISIIKKMLRSEVVGIGIPEIGTPQGGILSPLLSNIVLNELDWWISNQWQTFETKRQYSTVNGSESSKFRSLRGYSDLKEMHIVRYADDFKIFCRDYNTAKKIYIATKMWLKERLKLDISEEKSKITSLKNNYTDFLGIKIKAMPKKNKFAVKSHIREKSKENCILKLRNAIYDINKSCTMHNVNKYNAIVLGLHSYYKIATMVSKDFYNIAFNVKKYLYHKLRANIKKNGTITNTFRNLYGDYHFKKVYILETALFPINGIRSKVAVQFNPTICNYTHNGRKIIHDKLNKSSTSMLKYLMRNPVKDESIEFNDNRLSLYSAQNGVCNIMKIPLEMGNMEVHHILPRNKGGNDKYKNLIILNVDVHKLIHAVDKSIIAKYIDKLQPNPVEIKKINTLREKVGNSILC